MSDTVQRRKPSPDTCPKCKGKTRRHCAGKPQKNCPWSNCPKCGRTMDGYGRSVPAS